MTFKNKKIKLKKLILKLNIENAPPGGWRPEDKATSAKRQAASALKKPQFNSIG